jgi:hypothetical protein
MCGVNDSLKNRVNKQIGAFGTLMDSDKIITFKLVIKIG